MRGEVEEVEEEVEGAGERGRGRWAREERERETASLSLSFSLGSLLLRCLNSLGDDDADHGCRRPFKESKTVAISTAGRRRRRRKLFVPRDGERERR